MTQEEIVRMEIDHFIKEKEKVMISAVENTDITVLEDNYLDDIKFILSRK